MSKNDFRGGGLLQSLSDAQHSKKVSAVELTQLALDRIAQAHALNAVILTDADSALAQASEIDRKRARGENLGVLAGLPALVKDCMDVRGLPTTHGSVIFSRAEAASADDGTVARLRAEDAVIIGKTNLSEFAMEAVSENLLFGATHNPWRLGVSPGGSSGGSAAAMAAGLAPLVTGTDGGGSVRVPAALCGLLGLKPTSGVTGASPARLPIELSSSGLFAPTAADLRTLARSTLGPTWGDPSCVYGPDLTAASKSLGKVFATTRIVGHHAIDIDVDAAFNAAVEKFGRMARTPPHRLEAGVLDQDADEIWADIYAPEDVSAVGTELLRTNYGLLDPRITEWVDRGLNSTLPKYLAARSSRSAQVMKLDRLLEDNNILLTPMLTTSHYPVGPLSGLLHCDTYNAAALNLTGHPALSVPAGNIDGVPFGLQIVGPRGSDMWLVELAGAWEAHEPWPQTAPGFERFDACL